MEYTPYNCGCDIGHRAPKSKGDIYTHQINYCPLHKAAPKLYEALKNIKWRLNGLCLDLRQAELAQRSLDIARKALAEVEGK